MSKKTMSEKTIHEKTTDEETLRMRGGGCGGSKEGVAAKEVTIAVDSAAPEPAPSMEPTTKAAASSAAAATELLSAHIKDMLMELSKLDDVSGLIEALAQGYIRLLRVVWLLRQPTSYLLENRQRLEERERAGEDPLLTHAEAAALLRKATRAVGVVSHGWLSPHHPDPAGKRLAVLIPALEQLTYIEALFFVRSFLH